MVSHFEPRPANAQHRSIHAIGVDRETERVLQVHRQLRDETTTDIDGSAGTVSIKEGVHATFARLLRKGHEAGLDMVTAPAVQVPKIWIAVEDPQISRIIENSRNEMLAVTYDVERQPILVTIKPSSALAAKKLVLLGAHLESVNMPVETVTYDAAMRVLTVANISTALAYG